MKFSSTYQPENKGRKKGSVNKNTALLRTATPEIFKKLIAQAKEGDTTAAQTVLRYSLPSKRSESQKLDVMLPEGATLTEKANLIADAALQGDCCPSVASQLISALGQVAKISEIDDLHNRIEALENDPRLKKTY